MKGSFRGRLAAILIASWSAAAAAPTGLEFLEPQDLAFVEVRGTVLNDSTGAPIAGATVLAIWEGSTYHFHGSSRHCLRVDATTTRADGGFSLKTGSKNVYRKGMAAQYVDVRIHATGMHELFEPGTLNRKWKMVQDQRWTLAKLIPPKEVVLDVSAHMIPTKEDVPDRIRALQVSARQPANCETMGNSAAVQAYFKDLAGEARSIAKTRYQKAVAEALAAGASAVSSGLGNDQGSTHQIMLPVYLSPELSDLERRDSGGATPLMQAAQDGNVPEVRALLKVGANPNRTIEAIGLTDGDGALTLAMAQYSRLKALKDAQPTRYAATIQVLLADLRTDPNLRGTRTAFTPLMKALSQRQDDVVEWLLAAGADPNLTAYEGRYTALGEALQALNTMTKDGKPFPAAAHQFELLMASPRTKLDLAIDDSGQTALIQSIGYGDAETVKQLLQAGANPNAPDRSKRMPLTAAVAASILNPHRPQFLDSVRLIASLPSVDVNAQYEGKTALQMAQSAGRKDLVAILERR